MNIKELQQEAIEKCFNSASSNHMEIMKEMIKIAFNEGRMQGQKEMSEVARRNLSDLIPDRLF